MPELFSNFEVNKTARWPIISKLLGASLVLHVLLLSGVLYIPGVRAAFNLASLIADTNFVDKDYDRTQIGDDIQFVQLPGEKFRYPDGYFAVDQQAVVTPSPVPVPAGPQFIASAPPPPVVAPELSISPSPTPVPTPATAIASAKGSPSPALAQAKASASPVASPALSVEQAQKELEKTAEKNNLDLPKENEINKKAMKDFAAYANDLKKQGKLDFNKPFEIVIEAELDENGKLKNPKFTKKAGDENLVDLFGRMVAALNDSGFLVYLKPVDRDNPGSRVVFTIKQGESEVLATVESEASSIESAKTLAKSFNLAISIGAQARAGKDEEALLKNTSAEPVGKKIVFNFTMPRQAVVDLIKKQLAPG